MRKRWRHRTPYIARYPSLSRLERLIFIALGTSHRVFAPYYAENYIKKEGKGTFERRKIRKKIYFSRITKIDKLAIRSSDFVTGNKTVEDCSLFLLKSSPDDMIDNVIIVKKSWIHCYYGKEIKEGREIIFRDVGECSVEVMEEEFCHCKRDWCPRYWEIYRARRIRTIILILKLGLNDFDYLLISRIHYI